eukprot:Skav215982  [mRNA]  locus=scaffold4378:13068:16429:+ [translate_table: standard]
MPLGAVATAPESEALAWKGHAPRQNSLPFRPDGKVDYESIDQSPVSQVLMGTVRNLLKDATGHDSKTPGYDGVPALVMELVREVNDMEAGSQLSKLRNGAGWPVANL